MSRTSINYQKSVNILMSPVEGRENARKTEIGATFEYVPLAIRRNKMTDKTTFVIDAPSLSDLNEALKVVSQAGYKAVFVARSERVATQTPKYTVIIEGPFYRRATVRRVVKWANFPGLLGRSKLNEETQKQFDSDLQAMTTGP